MVRREKAGVDARHLGSVSSDLSFGAHQYSPLSAAADRDSLPRRYRRSALDSDGNLILNLGVLGTIANENPTNLTVLVMDNGNYLGSHKKEPGMRTATGGKMKLQEVAKGCGIASAHLIQGAATFREKIQM